MAALLEAARRRNPLPTGTAAVGVGLIVAGMSAYGFLFIANKALSDAEYSPLGVLWSLVFLCGPGLFLPFEQEISRALAERRARGFGGAPGPGLRRGAGRAPGGHPRRRPAAGRARAPDLHGRLDGRPPVRRPGAAPGRPGARPGRRAVRSPDQGLDVGHRPLQGLRHLP